MAYDFPSSPAVGQVYQPAGGPSWQWDGTAWTSYQSGAETALNRIFVPGVQGSATNYTYNKPANLRYLEIEGVAAGGSGASALATTASIWSHGSAGGGGSWGRKLFRASDLPTSFAAVIGAPGAASSSGSGNTAADTTVSVPGMGLTLPGGMRGQQGGNVAYTAIAQSTASGITALPTGWDVSRAGESGDSQTVSLVGGGSSTWAIGGRAGSSPWGVGGGSNHGTGWGSTSGYGYGWGSGGSANAGSAALRNSVPGGPGALLFTEYLAVAAVSVIPPLTAETRNRIVNPAMQISQENGSTANGFAQNYPADQWLVMFTTATSTLASGRFSLVTPRGSPFRLRCWCATAKPSLAAGDYAAFVHRFEGVMVTDFLWGTAGAKQVVLRFGFKGPAGTYSVSLRNYPATHNYTTSFTVTAGEANLDVERTLVIPGATVAVWAGDNTLCIDMWLMLASGTSYFNTTPNTWAAYASGVGLAVTTQKNGMDVNTNVFELFDVGLYMDPNNTGVPPRWEFPDENDELARCQRYYLRDINNSWCGNVTSGVIYYSNFGFGVTMRTSPLISMTAGGTSGFPNVAGNIDYQTNKSARESHTANATVNGGLWNSGNIVLNARL